MTKSLTSHTRFHASQVTDFSGFSEYLLATEAGNKIQTGKASDLFEYVILLFFMLMLLKGIHPFATMHRWVKAHYALLGWQKAPDRTTIRRRFLELPAVIQLLMPAIAQHCLDLDYARFGYACSFADKSVFRALGGLWHKKHRLLKMVPHSSIDTEASWAKSEYHGWRFGYGLHRSGGPADLQSLPVSFEGYGNDGRH